MENIELISLMEDSVELLKTMRQKAKHSPGQMNLLDLLSTSHLENNNSTIIATLLNPNSRHNHPEFGKKFLYAIKKKCNSLEIKPIKEVTREKPTDSNRRIDIFIETESNIIIIENKINAYDLGDQIKDYKNWADNYNVQLKKYNEEKKVIVIYLTLRGGDPSEISFDSESLQTIKDEGRYASLTYSDDIIPWLEDIITEVKCSEVELYSAIIQYTDSLKGLCRLKKENIMEDLEFTEMLLEKYGNLNRDDLKLKLDAIELLSNQMAFIALVNFMKELYSLLKTSYNVYYTHHQKRYSNEEYWISEIKKDKTDIGLEVALEQQGSNKFGLGIELPSIGKYSDIFYGTMSHGIKENDETIKDQLDKLLENWIPKVYKIDYKNPLWFKLIYGNNWVTQGICRVGEPAMWEEKANRSLAEHLFIFWFKPDLENWEKLPQN